MNIFPITFLENFDIFDVGGKRPLAAATSTAKHGGLRCLPLPSRAGRILQFLPRNAPAPKKASRESQGGFPSLMSNCRYIRLMCELVDVTGYEYNKNDDWRNELKVELNDFVLRELYAVSGIRLRNEAVPSPAFFPRTEKQEQK